MKIDLAAVRRLYDSLPSRHEALRRRLGRGLTYAEKVLFAHLDDPAQPLERGKSDLKLRVDRVAMQDATAQMALLQFMCAGRPRVAVPTTVHCDHLIQAYQGASKDLAEAMKKNDEVYAFLASASRKYGIGFWKPGAGIIHQVVLEHYAVPGMMMIGTDSHTPNAGGLGMIAVGVGGADAVDALVGLPWVVKCPRLVGVRLTGRPSGWASGKDVIIEVARRLTVKGGTGKIVEYFGDGAAALSATAKATITNMGAEIGATTSIFPFDASMASYLRSTGRAVIADLAEAAAAHLRADPEVLDDPRRFFDEVIEIDLSTLAPQVAGPHTPDLGRPVSALRAEVAREGWPAPLSAALIGSCTNSSYEDMTRAADVCRQAVAAGLKAKVEFLVTPGSEQVHRTMRRDGLIEVFERAGGTVLANACGPCIGQWNRPAFKDGVRNSIITSYNRNFRKRNDGNPETHAFIASPEIVTAFAFAGTLDFDPTRDSIDSFRFRPPTGVDLPTKGFEADDAGYVPPAEDGAAVEVAFRKGSERLAPITPFEPWSLPRDFEDLAVLVKAKGKCTTDHISQAGPWLRYRGHLDKISDNMFLGAVNAFTGEAGKGRDGRTFAAIARAWKAAGIGWVAVGDENYGEGSSREHAAMEPRHLGGRAVIAKSFARIHETNLKKQGLLPLRFEDPRDYDRILEDDLLTIRGVDHLTPDGTLEVEIRHTDGRVETISVRHTLSAEEIGWFRAGSALGEIRLAETRRVR